MQHWNLKIDDAHLACAVSRRTGVVVSRMSLKLFWLAFYAVMLPTITFAQQENETDGESDNKIGVVRKAPTEIVLLRDKNGNLVKVATNLSLEEYLRLYNQQNDVEDNRTPPAFALDQVVYTGRATTTHLAYTAEFRVQLIQSAKEQWVKVPLRLPQSVMRSAPQYTGAGEFFVTWDTQLGHVVWLRGDINSQHVITLKLTRPLRKTGQITELVLQAPVARSQFKQLVVPVEKAQAVAGELEVRASNAGNSTTAFTFDFQTEELVFGWSTATAVSAQPLSRIQASVETGFAVHQNRNISARGVLNVGGLGGNVTDFEVLLPSGMTLLDLPNQAFRVARVPVADDETDNVREKVRVSIVRPQPNVAVILEAELRHDASETDTNQPFNGFEVVDAVKQSGKLSISTTSNWDVVWQLSGDMRRAPRVFDTAAGSPGIQQFDFEYYNVAYTVVGVLQERENQFRVVPNYLLEVTPTQIRMTTTLRCIYSGSGQYMISGNWLGWELDQVFQSFDDSLQLVNAELIDGQLAFQVSTLDTDSRGEFEVIIRARRQLPGVADEGERPLDLIIPQLTVTSEKNASILRGAQTVVLQAADNVELVPDSENIEGLLAGSLSDISELDLPDYQQTPLVFNSLPNLEVGKPLRFVGNVGTRKRSVLVASSTAIQLEDNFAAFEQVLDYQIAYEPIRQITLTVPGIVRRPENLRVFLQLESLSGEDGNGNSVLPWSAVPSSIQSDEIREQLEIEQVTVDLLAEFRGSLRIVLRYQEQLPLLMADSSQRVNFLLVSPLTDEVRLVQNQVTINTQDIFVSEPADDVWQVVRGVASEEAGGDSLRLQASEAATSLPVQMRMRRDVTRTSTLIQRRWIQTALLNEQCRERMSMLIRTNETDLHIQFPVNAVDPATLIVAVNSQRVPVEQVVLDSQGQLTIRLAASNVESDYRIELWYMRSTFDSKHLKLPLPQVVNSKMSGSTYWQVVTTNHQHLLGSPQGWTPEYDWSWSGFYWFRDSALQQSDLESWVGVTNQLALPENTNQYLLSTVGEVDSLNATITSRSTLLILLSGMVLLVGLAILRLHFMQQPVVIFCVGLFAALAGIWVPELMLLVLQASFLGGLLVILSRVLDWVLAVPGRSNRPIHRTSIQPDTNSAAISLLKLESSIAADDLPPATDDSQQQQA
ncbi:MAG: hypothetical protein CMJ76_10315 [Planctomycetaceae bacterium]|nr:hypothetical protein [Planctomycetaceae bacterium]|tara:strand:- start:267 stop:3767 length:3501 start_codon:yes stop_codon:yes gene_type:complete